MKLFIATPSPFARKARVTLLEKQIPHEIVIDNPWQPASQVKGLNPLAKIPTLVLDDGRVIHDSKVIFEYLELERPGHLPQDKHEKIIHRLVEVVADGICDAVVMTFLKTSGPRVPEVNFGLVDKQTRFGRESTSSSKKYCLLGHLRHWVSGSPK